MYTTSSWATCQKLALDEAYLEKDQIAKAVKDELDATMENFGFAIVRALVTDIVPDARVKTAMNEINAARREQEAALAKGEADKTIAVKKAEAEAESKRLQGEGIAAQRKAMIAGLKESVEDFQKVVEGATAKRRDDPGPAHAISRHAERDWRVFKYKYFDAFSRPRRDSGLARPDYSRDFSGRTGRRQRRQESQLRTQHCYCGGAASTISRTIFIARASSSGKT